MWHVPNRAPLRKWRDLAILRYHTETGFLSSEGGNLLRLYEVPAASGWELWRQSVPEELGD